MRLLAIMPRTSWLPPARYMPDHFVSSRSSHGEKNKLSSVSWEFIQTIYCWFFSIIQGKVATVPRRSEQIYKVHNLHGSLMLSNQIFLGFHSPKWFFIEMFKINKWLTNFDKRPHRMSYIIKDWMIHFAAYTSAETPSDSPCFSMGRTTLKNCPSRGGI